VDRDPRLWRGLLVAIAVLATAVGMAACGPSQHHHHPKTHSSSPCCESY
jgi:hypothetical protein